MSSDSLDVADYRTHIFRSIDEVGAARWDSLVPDQAGHQPFARHAFLSLMETTKCVGGETGWIPLHLGLERNGSLVAVAPLYAKTHSYGEYVFDWAWAEAYQRHGLPYYPKLLSAIPFTPVPGPRLLARDENSRLALAKALIAFTRSQQWSSFHVLFPGDGEARCLEQAGAMLRHGVQFHWQNEGWPDFGAFLQSLRQDKRKKIRAERRRVAESGIIFRRLTGSEIKEADWRFFYRCYATTYREHHSTPYLNEAFFLGLGAQLRDSCLMIVASEDSVPIAASLLLHDGRRLFGRYWGALVHRPMLHFETCYYQAIEHAIQHGFQTIEGGAQGEHKLARGFVPVPTVSAHWLGEPAFADAVERFLRREGQAMGGYIDELNDRKPFRTSA